MAEEAFEMEKMEPRGFSWRRNSTRNINTKISLVLPRYLSAPLASCHDNCKYGGKRSNNNSEEAARIPKRFASKLQKKPLSEEERLYMMEKKFAGTLIKKQKAIFPAMIRQNRVLGHDNVKRFVSVSAKHHICSSKTKGISRSSQKGGSLVETSEDRETRTQHKQDDEETLFVIKEHKEDSIITPHSSSEETEDYNSEQENNANSLPRKLVFRRGKVVEETLLKDNGDISPRKLVVQYIVVEENKTDCTEVFDNTTIEDHTAANTPAAENVFGNNVKTLIGAFESVILLGRDGNPLPAAADNMFSNVKALISAFESVISQKLLAPNASQIEIN
nr:histone-lysine N-methyltransferase SETDB1-A-like [Ipomoea trifida]